MDKEKNQLKFLQNKIKEHGQFIHTNLKNLLRIVDKLESQARDLDTSIRKLLDDNKEKWGEIK